MATDCSAHPGEHDPGHLTMLDSFAVSLKTISEPASILLKVALEPDWVIPTVDDPKLGIIELVAVAVAKMPPPMMFPAILLEVEGMLNAPEAKIPMLPLELPGIGKVPLGSLDIAGDIMSAMGGLPSGPDMPSFPDPASLGLDLALASGTAMAGLVVSLAFDLPMGLIGAAIALDPPTPPDFGIPDIIATLPGFSVTAAEILSECLIAKFVPLVPYEDPSSAGARA